VQPHLLGDLSHPDWLGNRSQQLEHRHPADAGQHLVVAPI
jgi:hypothetical protein